MSVVRSGILWSELRSSYEILSRLRAKYEDKMNKFSKPEVYPEMHEIREDLNGIIEVIKDCEKVIKEIEKILENTGYNIGWNREKKAFRERNKKGARRR